MLHLFAFLAGVAFTSSAFAQPSMVLVEKPPIYTVGESHDGYVYNGNTRIAQLHQTVIKGKDGKPTIRGEHIVPDGHVAGYFMTDPSTMLGMSIYNNAESITVMTTCSLKDMYPIILGKTYQCMSLRTTDDHSYTTIDTWDNTIIEHDAAGGVTAICGKHIHKRGPDVTTIRFCTTPDGKWTEKMSVDLPRKGSL